MGGKMKYKLINNQTKEEHLCDKVTIDGFDYYISEEKSLSDNGDWYLGHPNYDTLSKWSMSGMHEGKQVWINKVIATNNPNIDIPKVINVVDDLALKETLYQIDLIYNTEQRKKDNKKTISILYFEGLSLYKTGYNKSQEIHPFSEEDMVKFSEWLAINYVPTTASKELKYWQKDTYQNKEYFYSTKELLQLWKEQRTKTLYYE